MTEKQQSGVAPAAVAEDVTTPPPAYLDNASTTPNALVQQETPAGAEPEITRAAPGPGEIQSPPANQTEQDKAITTPPPTHQPMQTSEPKTAPGQTITVTPLPRLTETPAWIDCPYCNHRTKTLVTSEGSSAQCMSAALCCLCCGIITVCIPFLCHWFEDTIIQCSGCKKQVALIPHDGPIQVLWPKPQPQPQPPQGVRAASAPAPVPPPKGPVPPPKG